MKNVSLQPSSQKWGIDEFKYSLSVNYLLKMFGQIFLNFSHHLRLLPKILDI